MDIKFINELVESLLTTLLLLSVPGIAGLILWTINETYYRIISSFDRKVILFTGAIGTPIHEIAHAFMAILFGMKVTKIELFKPDPVSNTLGSVEYRYIPTKFSHKIGLFFVGLAPLMAGSYLILLLFYYADLPTLFDYAEYKKESIFDEDTYYAVISWTDELFHQINSWFAFGVIIFAMAIGQHSTPSKADMKGTMAGLLSVIIFLTIGVMLVRFFAEIDSFTYIQYFNYGLNHFAIAVIQLSVFSTICGLVISFVWFVISKTMALVGAVGKTAA